MELEEIVNRIKSQTCLEEDYETLLTLERLSVEKKEKYKYRSLARDLWIIFYLRGIELPIHWEFLPQEITDNFSKEEWKNDREVFLKAERVRERVQKLTPGILIYTDIGPLTRKQNLAKEILENVVEDSESETEWYYAITPPAMSNRKIIEKNSLIPLFLDVSRIPDNLRFSKLSNEEFQNEDAVPFGLFMIEDGFLFVMGRIGYTCSGPCHLQCANTNVYWHHDLRKILDNGCTERQRRLMKDYFNVV